MSDLLQMQRGFTAWIRRPDVAKIPAGLDLRRINLYRELLFGNISGFVENAFPVLQSRLPAALWGRLQEGFFADHRCQSPLFRDIAHEFLQYLQTQDWLERPWVPELAHYEWALIAADTAEGSPADAEAGDVWTSRPVLSPFAWPLIYQWPVHRFWEEEPGLRPEAATALLIYRSELHEVRRMPLSMPAAALLEALQRQPVSVTEAVAGLAGAQGIDHVWLRDHLHPWIQAWEAEGIIRGIEAR